eukprot:00013.XXX_1912_1266_1 [CDS] Oithona nana genome sequencing.
MLEQFKKETVASEIKRFIFALAASEDEEILKEYLDLTLDRDTIRLQDVIYVFRGIMGQRKGAETAMTWLADNFESIMNDYGNADGLAGGGSISKYISTIFSGYANFVNTVEELQVMKDFIEDNNDLLNEEQISIEGLEESVKMAELNIKWHEQHGAVVKAWLKEKFEDDPENGSSNLLGSCLGIILPLILSIINF